VVGGGRINRSRHLAVVDHAAGPTTGLINEPDARRERDGVLLPVEQVNGADVAPMDRSVHGRLGVVLEEDVIAAVKPA
jgi:hypothetical protein